MKNTFDGLGMFYEFLKRTGNYLKSDGAVKRLAWCLGEPPANGKRCRADGDRWSMGRVDPSRRIGAMSRRPPFGPSSTRA